MTGDRQSGRADLVVLVVCLLVGAGMVLAAAAPRSGASWEAVQDPSSLKPPATANPEVDALATNAEALAEALDASRLPDSARRLHRKVETAPTAGLLGVTGLDGRIARGTLYIHWRPAPGSEGTELIVNGLGGPGEIEREVTGDDDGRLELPVVGISGTAVISAFPLMGDGSTKVVEARVSVPFRISVEVVRAVSASPGTGSALLLLRRPFEGRSIEAVFPVAVAETLGGLSSPMEGGSPVDFRTEFVLEEIRRRREEEPAAAVTVPVFLPDGRVARDVDGTLLTRVRRTAARVLDVVDVVLRGPGDQRRVLPLVERARARDEDR